MVENLLLLACKFDLDQIERKSYRKSTQVNARSGQMESQVDQSFKIASFCGSVWPGLYTAEYTCNDMARVK